MYLEKAKHFSNNTTHQGIHILCIRIKKGWIYVDLWLINSFVRNQQYCIIYILRGHATISLLKLMVCIILYISALIILVKTGDRIEVVKPKQNNHNYLTEYCDGCTWWSGYRIKFSFDIDSFPQFKLTILLNICKFSRLRK